MMIKLTAKVCLRIPDSPNPRKNGNRHFVACYSFLADLYPLRAFGTRNFSHIDFFLTVNIVFFKYVLSMFGMAA